jgi:putative ABC transport system permease protein
MINERAASRYWPGEDPIGKRITFDDDKNNPPTWLTIIGIVKDAKQYTWAGVPDPEVYLAALQSHDFLGDSGSHMSYITLVVRTSGDPASYASAMKEVVWSFDRNLPVSEVFTMDQVVADANAEPRFEMLLLGVFAVVALVLAAVGIYGVMSYSVSRRTHEIGIRLSLGATRGEVLRMVVRQGMALALFGAVAGLIGALLLSHLLTGMLYGIRPNDPLTFGGVAALLGLVALLATYVPARRATRIDPMVALRYE